MSDFFLYKKETDKPHFVLVVEDRVWNIPFTADIEPGKGRIAIEASPSDADGGEIVESGSVIFKRKDGGKMECVFHGSMGSFMNGDFVFVLPSWGRHTEKRLWVVIKSGKKVTEDSADDKTHSHVATQKQ